MNNLQLYINDELADLSDDNPMALTFQINNLAEVKNQQGNTSNQFKLPLTQRNRRILGFPDEIAFTNNKPYTQYQARIIQDGLELIPYGVGELNGIDQDTASITILSGNVDFFDAIDGQLYDMGDSTSQLSNYGKSLVWQPYDHVWNLQNVVASQPKTEGWIWPVVDYGKISAASTDTFTVDVNYQRPGFFLKTAIELLAKSAGYKIDPDSFLIKEPLYQQLIVQFANDSFEHGTDAQNGNDGLSVEVSGGMNQVFNNNTVNSENTGVMQFTQIVTDQFLAFHFDGYTYVAPSSISVTVTLTFGLEMTGMLSSSQIRVGIRVGNTDGSFTDPVSTVYDLSDNATIVGVGRGYKQFLKQKMSCDVDLAAGQSIVIFYVLQNKNHTNGTIYAGADLSIQSKEQQVIYGQTIQCERIFPDISQKDLLKDTLQRFGIICQTNNTTRTIRLASFRDIVNNIPRAKDWSAKCLDQGKSINFQLGGYAQVNYMKYKTDDNVLPPTLGQSQINVTDATLPATADLFQSQFAPTLNIPFAAGSIAQIKKVEDGADSFSIGTEPRILIDEKLSLGSYNKSVNFTDGSTTITVNDVVSVPYFDKPGGQYSLLFDKLRLAYYPELEKILKQSKKVVRYILLSPRDILELDLLVPVYIQQDGAYYYINKIDSWRKGQPTKVELVKLG